MMRLAKLSNNRQKKEGRGSIRSPHLPSIEYRDIELDPNSERNSALAGVTGILLGLLVLAAVP